MCKVLQKMYKKETLSDKCVLPLQIVASSHCRENFDTPEGFPDAVVLTTPKLERTMRDAELGYKYKFDYIEIAGLWLNTQDRSPEGIGTYYK